MLAIGRALMSDPKLLLLDEPSLGLAPLLVRAIFDIVREINRSGVTILLVEQNARAALQAGAQGLRAGDRQHRALRAGGDAAGGRTGAEGVPRRTVRESPDAIRKRGP